MVAAAAAAASSGARARAQAQAQAAPEQVQQKMELYFDTLHVRFSVRNAPAGEGAEDGGEAYVVVDEVLPAQARQR